MASPEHPLYPLLKACGFAFFEADADARRVRAKLHQHLESNNNVLAVEFSLRELKDKCDWIATLTQNQPLPIIAEAGHLCGEILLEQNPRLQGISASAFFSPTQKVEIFTKDQTFRPALENLLGALNLSPYYVPRPKLAFTYPRAISMLANEAHLALSDGLASANAMDTAMKFGVNYPLGLVEWSERIGAAPIVKLLDALYAATKDERYQATPSLRAKAQI